jgi:hypothetical protein
MIWMDDLIDISEEFEAAWSELIHTQQVPMPILVAMGMEMTFWRTLQNITPRANWPTLFQRSAHKLHSAALRKRKCANLYGR